MLPDTLDMGLGELASRLDRIADHIVLVSIEAHFGIYNDRCLIGIKHHYIGNKSPPGITLDLMAPTVGYHPLCDEMDPLNKSGILKHISQKHLTEISLYLGVTCQGIGEIPRLLSYRLGTLQDILDVFLHRGTLSRALQP